MFIQPVSYLVKIIVCNEDLADRRGSKYARAAGQLPYRQFNYFNSNCLRGETYKFDSARKRDVFLKKMQRQLISQIRDGLVKVGGEDTIMPEKRARLGVVFNSKSLFSAMSGLL